MHLSHITFLAAISAVLATDAPVITGNPAGVKVATNPHSWIGDTSIVGEVTAESNAAGGVSITVSINGGAYNPYPGGPFLFHVHNSAIPAGGNCLDAGAHLDPTNRTETPPCDASQPQTCQVGDLAGKHGTCGSIPGCSKSFTDLYLSLTPGNAAYMGDKSVVLHYANTTRFACANFVVSGSASYSKRWAS